MLSGAENSDEVELVLPVKVPSAVPSSKVLEREVVELVLPVRIPSSAPSLEVLERILVENVEGVDRDVCSITVAVA